MRRSLAIFSLILLSAQLWAGGFKTGLNTQMERLLANLEDNLGYINTHSDEEVSNMASWFLRHGNDDQKSRALYCLGRNQYNSKRYPAAIVTYTKALEYAAGPLPSARIYFDMAQTSAATMNMSDQVTYLGKAAEAYKSVGYDSEAQNCYLEIGKAQMGRGDYGTAESIFKSILGESHDLRDTLLEARCLEAYASLAVQKDTADPYLAIDMLSRAAEQLRYNLGSTDKGILAYSYSLIGNAREAQKWLSEAKASAETPAGEADAAFREYQICARNGEPAKALAALERVVGYGNKAQAEALGETVAASQRDYFRSEAQAQAEKLKAARLKMWLISLAALLAIAALAIAAYLRRQEERRKLEAETAEKDRYLSLAEDLRKQLVTSSAKQDEAVNAEEAEGTDDKKTSPKIPWNVDALERLCEQYYIYEGTENLQPKILKEVKSIVEGLRSDSKIQKSLENLLDDNYDGIMQKLRKEFPNWKNEEYLLYIFTASGFSTTTISTLLEKDKKAIYNRVWRLKNRIDNSDAPDKDIFLKHLK
ncbi:MAG: hypothetical protein LKK16_07280 [Bacteroidales bacterium]|jgi:hypothetical protein|nr:hypothetical protein [Bacteroidales bacterium]MCI2136104.1 hypothetical protein [Bacteroidales bacterium]